MALHEVLDDVGRNALIMLFVGAHYRQPMAFDDMRLMEALARVARVRDAARGLVDGESPAEMRHLRDAFFEALRQDFNTPAALAAMFDWIKEANRRADEPVGRADLVEMLSVLGLQNLAEHGSEAGAEEQELLDQRVAARAPATTPRPTACATSCAHAAGRCATGPTGRSSCASSSDPLRPQPRARGAARRARRRSARSGRPSASSRASRGCARPARGSSSADGDRAPRRLARPPGRLRRGRRLPVRLRRRAAHAAATPSSSRSTSCRIRRTSARSRAAPSARASPASSSASAARRR